MVPGSISLPKIQKMMIFAWGSGFDLGSITPSVGSTMGRLIGWEDYPIGWEDDPPSTPIKPPIDPPIKTLKTHNFGWEDDGG